MLKGLMMDRQLTVTSILRHAQTLHEDSEIVSITADIPLHRYSYKDCFARAAKLANALARLGANPGDRIGTLAWNDFRHLEIYYAVACSGLVCHTINPRLFEEQIEFIVNHADDQWLFVDVAFLQKVESLASKLSGVKGFVVLTDAANLPATSLPNVVAYEELIENESTEFAWPELDENTACALCYTSGTTGNPKGALYSHRAIVLHSYGESLPDALGLKVRDTILPVVPMFHVNAWGIPYAGVMTGAKLVLPGPKLGDGETLYDLIENEGVTIALGVPTVWLNLLNYTEAQKKSFSTFDRVVIGGSACPMSMLTKFEEEYGVRVLHLWGMTEMTPIGTGYTELSDAADLGRDALFERKAKQGRPVFGVELRIVDDNEQPLAHDGKAFGALQVRGPWVCESYYQMSGSDAHTDDGWFRTGDVATIDPNGFMQITDRTKDVIKSGGEWISSIELENIAVAHPGVAEAAVIGVPHPKWDERPLLVVVKAEGSNASEDELLAWYDGKVASWWVPNGVAFVDEIPHTATGKISKLTLRASFEGFSFSE